MKGAIKSKCNKAETQKVSTKEIGGKEEQRSPKKEIVLKKREMVKKINHLQPNRNIFKYL
jgi:hypothetical protein